MKLIIGLGNPGEKYQYTRHNIGFWLLEELAKDWKIHFHRKMDCESLLAEGKIGEKSFILAKPLTYMNNSGRAAEKLLQSFGLSHQDTLVILDDVFLKLGMLRFRLQGSSGGHKGLASILSMCQSNEFPRLRLGVGLPQEEGKDYADYVLSPFELEELEETRRMIETAQTCVSIFISQGSMALQKWLSDYQSRKQI
ncbi:MAG: aminoacyl-tRNA hydrolase [Chlamydiae bacterium]|nr:aminoacyl-tRNA hydrolase [Chlamydiota bacterium]MBI3277555.1 aminoacyl-tRNA hydrolase [Chlamydiota bacterium]